VQAYRKLVQRLGSTRAFAVVMRPLIARVDRFLFRLTRGRLVPTATVAPVLLLTTTGRRTGRRRTTPVMYAPHDGAFLVSSEDFGERARAAWPLNLAADPQATVQVGKDAIACRARRLGEAEADEVWPKLLELWPAHEVYRRRNGRRHTFLLVPV
jgi:deazaflavin-dependent oxidoreductase (nitroreductase family)